ncbi:hypothetical protein A1O3_03542 [Capronia epimyces CBS 606.96]|uniref:Allergen n=1 Tax=Capronia epimyces CBS 606.96 TaxID=1182542 RepID=W9YWD1_9EURO|nr:uncharacterized protein A1O3_03542 [Capronia epimyces CBS 606.96]EXJ86589.1 hypothetical protein A1O3_03542 [Capronia epimyces CBS 606.96]
MEAAKAAVSKFTSHRGHHTTVDETVQPAITRETVKPVRHEEAQQAIDREVHQHHYHTTVQPLEHKEQLPEKHTHNLLPTEHREYRHENEGEIKQKVQAELGHFKDTRNVHEVRETQSAAPAVTGEHVHHHVHETVVPVVHKETIQPEVVHTTIPVHEKHHAASQHHGLSALPMKTLDEFNRSGGVLTGGKHDSHEEYDGAPRPYNDKLQTNLQKLGLSETGATTGHHTGHHAGVEAGRSQHGSGLRDQRTGLGGVEGRREEYGTGVGDRTGHHGGLDDGRTQQGSGLRNQGTGLGGVEGRREEYGAGVGDRTGTGVGDRTGNQYNTETSTGTKTKPSLMDRLNPRKDADGDGKAGLGD